MKTITVKNETWKEMSSLKLKYEFSSFDDLIVHIMKGGKIKCLEERKKKKE